MESPADRLTTVIVTVSNQSWGIAKAKQNTPNLRLKFSPFNSYCSFFFAIHYMLSISLSVFHSVVYVRTKQGRKNWLRSASNIFVTVILVKMASLRRNNVSQPISFISEETNIFVSTMLIIDAIFQTKKIFWTQLICFVDLIKAIPE